MVNEILIVIGLCLRHQRNLDRRVEGLHRLRR